MTEQEILKYVYEMREISPFEAKALLSAIEKNEHRDIRERLDAVSIYEDSLYADVWLWEAQKHGDEQCRKKAEEYREVLLQAYCGEQAPQLCLTGRECFYQLVFFAGYETAYGTLQYYEAVSRMLGQVKKEERNAWYLYALVEIRRRMKESVFEYQAQLTELFKETFAVLCQSWNSLPISERMLALAAAFEACRQHILLPYKYWEGLTEWYRTLLHHMDDQDEEQRAGYLMLEMKREAAVSSLGY